jgi:DNA-3-methyladenine glycosylase I
VPAVTPESTALAKELKRRGFRFVGPTTAYAGMQACGLVNDHLEGCCARAA